MRSPWRFGPALLGLGGMLGCGEARSSTEDVAAARDHAASATAAALGLARFDLAGAPAWRVTLPRPLHEVSGLAVTPDGRLFAHGDEEATIHQVDPRAGTVTKSFSLAPGLAAVDLGKKQKGNRLAGDFEGLAIVGDRFFLVTSNGVLLEFAEGDDGAEVPSTAHVTGLDQTCEVEGLDYDPTDRSLLLLCKTMRDGARREQVAVYAWSLSDRALESTPRLTVPWSALAPLTGARGFNGSALAVAPGGRSLALVAGPQRRFAEVTDEGAPVSGGALRPDLHPQPEGLAFLPDGTLLVASEGGKGDATLSGYRSR